MVFLNQILFKYYESLGICYILYYLDIHKKELKSIQPVLLNPGTWLLFVTRSSLFASSHVVFQPDACILWVNPPQFLLLHIQHILLYVHSQPFFSVAPTFVGILHSFPQVSSSFFVYAVVFKGHLHFFICWQYPCIFFYCISSYV